MHDFRLSEAGTRTEIVRRRRCLGVWQPPPADWPEIVRRTWPSLIRHAPSKVPDGWCDLILAMADHLDGRQITIVDAFEDPVTGKLSIVHSWRRGAPEDDSNSVIDGYEALSLFTCRKCARECRPIRRGSGRLATTRVVCDRHEHGDSDE